MAVYRLVKDGVIINRIVVSNAKALQPDWLEAEGYVLETEDPPPQIGWTENDEGGFDPPPPVQE